MRIKRPPLDDSRRVDAYIARAAPFAQPILRAIRAGFHAGCPDVEERIKWGVPAFEKHGLLGGMAAFQRHASFGFWRAAELPDPKRLFQGQTQASFMSIKLQVVAQLPSQAVLAQYVRRAVKLNAAGPQPRKLEAAKRPSAKVPALLTSALAKDAKAKQGFARLTAAQRRDYVEWLNDAKRPETKASRLKTTLQWLREGKSRNWKYQKPAARR